MSKNRPPRHPAQTSKLTDANNTAQPELSFQRKPVHTRRAQENLSVPNSVQYPPTVAVPEYTIHATSCVESSEDEDIDDQSRPSKKQRITLSTMHNKRTTASDEDASSEDDVDEEDRSIRAKRTRASLGDPKAVDHEGLLINVDVQPINEDVSSREDKRRDVNHFFQSPVEKVINGKVKKYCICNVCPDKKSIVNEITTLRRHMEAHHSAKYRKWAQDTNYESRLPGDIKKRKVAAGLAIRTPDRDLRENKPKERVVPYSDKALHQAMIEWLITTDQPLQALEHPTFKEMIHVASRATNGVKIPDQRSTRAEIKRRFKEHLAKLRRYTDGDDDDDGGGSENAESERLNT